MAELGMLRPFRRTKGTLNEEGRCSAEATRDGSMRRKAAGAVSGTGRPLLLSWRLLLPARRLLLFGPTP